MNTKTLFLTMVLVCGCFAANIYKFGPFVKAEEQTVKVSDLALKTSPEKIMEILKSKDLVKRKYLAKCFDVEEFVKTECWKEEYKNESVLLEKQQKHDVLFYRNIADQSGEGKALFLFYKNEGMEKKIACMLEFEEMGARVKNAEGTFEYRWETVIEGNGISELVISDYYGGHARSEKIFRIFKMIDGSMKEILNMGLGGYLQVSNSKFVSYEATVDIEKKGNFPRKIEYLSRDTSNSADLPWSKIKYSWDVKSRKYVKE